MMIERIRREHGYMARLLVILKNKLELLKQEREINYSLIAEVVHYLMNHSDKVHHPKEDIIYRYYLNKYGNDQAIEDLELEHQLLAEKTADFLGVVDMILQDAVVPQEVFIEQLEEFVHTQRKHMEYEEKYVLPMIITLFTVKDWQEVESQWSQPENDPVFGDTIADQYRQLADRVRQNEQECL
ncbi:hemerythrin domain-containing protein [Vibrio toranzoniae]|uniref:hemerythrin domain-containing protein n=1 Tax=Vibrio toranzoniae TaxID=1194427 RepID=UPI0013777E08|nr:hemerythrin domain-containing protein [Vibrio toranzoniae]NAZ45730.1 hemerythrin domain-containing protein [Vibrio toranzoniae]NAZ96513.1 hemerythrin domain-containing protein [Vibrio toranzoniae]